MRILFAVLTITLLLAWSFSCCVAVDRSEYVYVTQWGQLRDTYDGETEAGLHFKLPWPVQTVQRIDHRLQVFDLPAAELLTHDPKGDTIDKTLTVNGFVCWRVTGKEGVDRFVRAVGTPERAETILGQRITSRLGAEVGRMRLDDLVSVVPSAQAAQRMDELSRRLLEHGIGEGDEAGQSFRAAVRQAYGVELVDIRLRRFGYPPQVRDAIFDRIRSERNRKVADYQSEGAQLADGIRSQAEYDARTLLAEARAAEQRLRGEAEAEADRIRNEAHAKAPAFYAFLKKLDEYQKILGDNKSVLLLSSHRDLFDLLFKPPAPESATAPPGGAVTSKPSAKNGRRP
jgi:modulator of FtsH protease HflC